MSQSESTPATGSAPMDPIVEAPSEPTPLRSSLDASSEKLVILPRKLPTQTWRQTQSNIPNERGERDRIKASAAAYVENHGLVAPLGMTELREHAVGIVLESGLDPAFADYAAVILNNEVWREELAQVPYNRRLLLLPKCMRVEEHCPAPFDEFGMLCKECGLCSIEDLTVEAERLGYAVLIAEGSAIVRAMIETGKIEAIVGVSCLNVLEKCFPHMEAVAIPGMSIPLLQDDCVNTNVDLDQVWDVIHLTSEDETYRLDLDGLKSEVQSWFQPEALDHYMGPAASETDRIAREWLARDGKRWRPYLSVCVHLALTAAGKLEEPELGGDLAKLAIAVECFHKASLIHDDIEDGDTQRYGEDALHAEYGVPVALNVGDLLLGEGYRLIGELDVDGETRAAMLAEAARGHVTLSRGQGAELCWARDPRPLGSLEVLGIFREKTAPAFEVALRLGAHFASAESEVHEVLGAYSEALGIAYQIRDDLEDFSGESDSNDLVDLRPSLILAIAHKRAAEGADQDLISRLWSKEVSYLDERAEVDRILEGGDVAQKARDLRDAYEEQAIVSLKTLQNPTLKGLLRRVIGKIFGDKHLIEGYCSEFEARNAAGGATGAEPAG